MAEAKTHKIDSKADLSRRARYEKLVASLYQLSIGMDSGSVKASP